MNTMPSNPPPFTSPPPDAPIALPPLDAVDVFKRLGIWTLIVGAAAAPSFFIAASFFAEDQTVIYPAMLAGIATWIAFYTWVSCGDGFRRRWKKPITRTTLYVGYSTRVLASLIFPIGGFVDMVCAIATAGIFGMVFGPFPGGTGVDDFPPVLAFVFYYVWTLFQGLILNIVLLIYMALVYVAQRPFRKPYDPNPFACPQCEYDLRASGDACPECGTAVPFSVRNLIETQGVSPAASGVLDSPSTG